MIFQKSRPKFVVVPRVRLGVEGSHGVMAWGTREGEGRVHGPAHRTTTGTGSDGRTDGPHPCATVRRGPGQTQISFSRAGGPRCTTTTHPHPSATVRHGSQVTDWRGKKKKLHDVKKKKAARREIISSSNFLEGCR